MSDKHFSLQPAISHDMVIELLDAYSTGELAASETVLVEQHLESCSGCQQFLQDVERFHALFAAQGSQWVYEVPSVSEAVIQEIQEAENVLVPMHKFEKLPQPPQKRKVLSRALMVMVAVFIVGMLVGSFVIVGYVAPAARPKHVKLPAVPAVLPIVPKGTPTQAPVDSARPLRALSQDDILWTLHMFDQNIGWATNHKGILRTSDGGAHWHNVSPTGPYDFGLSTINFFSPQITWMAVINNTTQKYNTFVTSDGGKSWLRSDTLGEQITLGPSVGVHNVSVVSAQECWLFATIPSAQSGLEAVVFHSTNGGKSWMVLPIKAIAGSMYVSGTFLDSATGWLVIGQFDTVDRSAQPADIGNSGLPVLFETENGGVSWQKEEIPLPYDLASGSFGQPTFFNAKEGVLPLIFTRTSTAASSVLVYTTHDGGASWNGSSILPLNMSLESGTITVTFDFWSDTPQVWGVTEIRRVAENGTDFYKDYPIVHLTQDGGRSWNQVEADTSLQMINGSAFVSPKVGWALGVSDVGRADIALLPEGTPGRSGGLLLKTTDGGQTWQTIPLVVN